MKKKHLTSVDLIDILKSISFVQTTRGQRFILQSFKESILTSVQFPRPLSVNFSHDVITATVMTVVMVMMIALYAVTIIIIIIMTM